MVPPKDKAFLDIKLVQECMDAHAKNISIAFMRWRIDQQCYENCGAWYCGQETNPQPMTVDQLYNKFIESITK